MADTNLQSSAAERSSKSKQDLPGCIKYILLLFLLILFFAEWGAGEYSRLAEASLLTWIILLVKLALIAGLIGLIRVQKDLKCNISAPAAGACVPEQTDTTSGFQYITVNGTASGGVFGHYTLAISGPYPYTVIYPPGGGGVPVVGGKLGEINTTALSDGSYTITLTVFPAGAGTPKVCTKTFNLLKVAVFITEVADVAPVPNFLDETAELVVGAHIVSVGGVLDLTGTAYVYGCLEVASVEVLYSRVAFPGPGPSQPAFDAALPPAWPPGNTLNPPLVYDPSKYYPWTRIGELPAELLNDWSTCVLFGTTYPALAPVPWDSYTTTGGVNSGGRYFLLLVVTDTATPTPNTYYDLQRTWVDNWAVVCQIVKFQIFNGTAWVDLPPCTDLLLSYGTIRIVGLAWDALIDSAWPATAPNDNFNQYSLAYLKQFSGAWSSIAIATPNVRVPNSLAFVPPAHPDAGDAGVLAEWDLTTLDAGVSTGDCNTPPPPTNQLYRGCSCTYTLQLGVSDNTVTNTASDEDLHNPTMEIPIKIVNDLT
jgi:hypothetical protein